MIYEALAPIESDPLMAMLIAEDDEDEADALFEYELAGTAVTRPEKSTLGV